MSTSVLVPEDISTLKYIITHVFSPLQLPDGDDRSLSNEHSLVAAVAAVAPLYIDHVAQIDITLWNSISRMLHSLSDVVQVRSFDSPRITSLFASMDVRDILTFMIRAQNAAVVVRRQTNVTIFESFELSPKAENVMAAQGKLICSYPGPAIEIPNVTFDDQNFRSELVNFLVHMNDDTLEDAAPTTRKAESTVLETRDTTHPCYITELLTGILRSVGRPADITRISKRVGDDVVWNNSKLPWRRSPLWLLIRVVVQTTLDHTYLGRIVYKEFMLFFMCCLGKERICVDLSSDMLQSITAKISRRLRKLGSSVPVWLSRLALGTCASLRSMLEKRWTRIQAMQHLSLPWNPSTLDLSLDTQLTLLNSGHYIRDRLADDSVSPTSTHFGPKHRRRGCLEDILSSDDGSFFGKAYHAEPHVTLYDVEQAVQEGIDGWVDRVTNNDEACVKLEVLVNEYSSSALQSYGNNPELLSVMLLTVIELWIALDKIAIKQIPMLAKYSPEIPTSLFEDLLLYKPASLHRLRLVHHYLSRRHSESNSGSVFSNNATVESFAVRYYRGSRRLRLLKNQIENVAHHEACEKTAELKKANARHAELQQEATRIEHTYYTNWYNGNPYHSRDCRKCDIEGEQERLRIDVHEWPLPANQLQAEVVIFELDCPISFDMWRAATFYLLVDLCSPSPKPQDAYITLDEYDPLRPYFVKHSRSRISLASDTKPFVVSHYRTVKIPTNEESVCVPNGLKFYVYDNHTRTPPSNTPWVINIGKYCTHKLQSGPYRNLQKYVRTTSHTSNEVLANQADCHKDLSIHEFLAFGHVRCGSLIQWLNILRELRGRSLTFRQPEVHLLIAQAVSQVGPLSNGGWIWHEEIQKASFCHAVLGELQHLLQDVQGNWLEAVTMDTISFLIRRVLTTSPDQAVLQRALQLLRTVRSKVFKWVEELTTKLKRTPEDAECRNFLRDGAAICRSTYDVGPTQILDLLNSARDVDILLFCSTLVHDYTPSEVSSLSTYSRLLLDRDCRLSMALESFVSDLVHADSDDKGIDSAISRVWANYRPGSKWVSLPGPNSRWFSCTTSATAMQRPQVVHLNLLNGSLLVDGKLLGRLPTEIVQNPLYSLIFGEKVLDVIPCDVPGMDYSTRGTVSDHQIHFSVGLGGSDLVIRAKRMANTVGDSEIMELIPREKLEGDIPAVLIQGHVHWLNFSTSIIEIRPLDKIWEASSENWRIDCTTAQYRMHKGKEILIDIRSPSWAMVSGILKPLDEPSNLLVSASHNGPDRAEAPLQLSVVLPRYGLSFYVDEDRDLVSRDIRGMVYDESQYIGTLFGLGNRLVLRPKIKDVDVVELIPRQILIPEGKIAFRKVNHHVDIRIDTRRPALGRVTYQIYKIDFDLGCLSTVGLTGRLYLAYLHALTSGCGTDPLTCRSGTEEALSLLHSANCWSIMRVSPRDAELLGLIASLCPSRTWYPVHLKCMQRVEWLNLPTNSQHPSLYIVAKAIKAHFQKLRAFQETQLIRVPFPSREDNLLERSVSQIAYLFPSKLSGQPSSANRRDVTYRARDVIEHNSGEHRAYTAATTVYLRAGSAVVASDILSVVESWSTPISGDGSLSLRFDKSWLAPDLPSIWLKAYNLLRRHNEGKWFQLLFSLPAMAYASPEFSDLVPVLVAFASQPQFCLEDPPPYAHYNLSDNYRPSQVILRNYVSSAARSFEDSPEISEPPRNNESLSNLRQRQRKKYNSRLGSDIETTANELLGAWPCESLPLCSLDRKLYDVPLFITVAQDHFSSCYRNLKLKEHLTRVQWILCNTPVFPTPAHQFHFESSRRVVPSIFWMIDEDQLFSRPEPSLQEREKLPRCTAQEAGATTFSGSARLHQLIATTEENAVNPLQHQYILALRASVEYFESEKLSLVSREGETKLPSTKTLVAHYVRCRASYNEGLRLARRHLRSRSWSEQAVERSGQWPRVTSHVLFQFLASNSPIELPDCWKRFLVQFALLALELQRARRLLLLHLDEQYEELRRELQNKGCDGWNAEMHPDWLLVQLQGNFLVRRIQAEVAREMISPHSGENTAMQLNMGEGKSSVIIPIVIVDLANGDQLVRVVVPKALTAQMFHLLVDRLGGLTNRRIYFLQFSRSMNINPEKMENLRSIMMECMKKRGILVVQPEHVLSLKLVSVEQQLPGIKDSEARRPLLDLQKWLHSRSRDILDESDEILHVRYQLVYTIGTQQHMEGFPERWTTTQQILSLVNKHVPTLRKIYPLGLEYERSVPGAFPHFRIVHPDAGQKLITLLLEDIDHDRLPNFKFGQLSSDHRDSIQAFISCKKVPPEKLKIVKAYSQESQLWSGLLLLRGLFATGILLFAFRERRWRVDYGLAPARTMLAVPYRAKDVPAQRAEFGHPDVAIILTCLSYYYGGLDEEQLRASFDILLQQDDPFTTYDLWVRACPTVPESLLTLNGINTKSSEQWRHLLFPLFSRNKATVDFYLSRVVFPREAMEFPLKLSCSGWDVAEKRERLLTGFSGTNDGQYLLPLHITQRDPDHQRGTNAKVLSYLLQPENNCYTCTMHENGERRTTKEFFDMLVAQKPDIRVLLDVGAQMLELENCQLAKAWLDIRPDVSAAIYFNEDDELTVLTRDEDTQLLQSSPFGQQLDKCVIYLDDAHTRGTDIKFPIGFRAAVTLGPKVTKDRLVQGCMRMRKLGHGHSIMFFAPLETDWRIRSLAKKSPKDGIDTIDILQWAIRETCDDIQRRGPHWILQGTDHSSRYAAWSEFCEGKLTPHGLSDKWLQSEAKSLEDLYGPIDTSTLPFAVPESIRRRCKKIGILSLRSASMDEEQEREVIHEAEHERQVERPPRVSAATQSIYRDVANFINTGTIPANSKAFFPAFKVLDTTSAVTKEAHVWSSSVLVTKDFQRTVKSSGNSDDYLRPVQWIVSGGMSGREVLVILSPHEVCSLLTDIRANTNLHLHLYTPHVVKSMKPCGDLSLYNIPSIPAGWIAPSLLMDQLNVFAGQLYLHDYETYIRLCRFLCVYSRDLENEGGIEVGWDGFIAPQDRPERLQTANSFQSSPLLSVKTLMGIRRKGMQFSLTHMGKLVDGRLLSEDDFEYL